jgi:hypothetical protein
MAEHFNHQNYQSACARACEDTRHFFHKIWGVVAVEVLAMGLGAIGGSILTPEGAGKVVSNIWPFGGAIVGLGAGFLIIFVVYLLIAPYRQRDEARNRLRVLEKERVPHISVNPSGGRRFNNWEHEHLMWAELDVRNTSPSLPLNDVEVKVVNLLDIVEKQDEPGEYILLSLHKWNPIQVYWSERNASPSQLKLGIPPNAGRIALIVFSDNSNGPPATINAPTSAKPLLFSGGAKIEVEVSSSNSALCRAEFYIQCHPKYITKKFPHYTEATFEFER